MRTIQVWIALLLTAAVARAQEPAAGEPPPVTVVEPAAESDLTPSLVSGPRELFAKGVALAERGAVAEAKTVFKALTLAYPQMPEPWVNLAVLLAAEGDEAGAAESAEAALDAHPVCRAAYRLELLRDLQSVGKNADESSAPALPPEAAPAPPAAAPASEAEVRATVVAWARAWADQRPDAYLAFYAPSFRPPSGLSRERWEARRRERITRPRSIEIEVSDLEIGLAGPGRARATFTQRYRSDTFRDVVSKTLELEKVGAKWKIVAEAVWP